MNSLDRVAIIGVGLIGGSIGLALRARGLSQRIVGIGRSASRLEAALGRGAVDAITTDLSAGVADADLVVVCTPVQQIVEHVRRSAAACRVGALITDAGSVKASVCRALEQVPLERAAFIGSHPMAGSEKSGVDHADADLFAGSVTVLTPTAGTGAEQLARVEAFWRSLGSRVLQMEPEEHDEAVARISHLPHAVAAVLANAADRRFLELAASGWRDTTRVAGGDPELWRQIFLDNRVHTLRALDDFARVLSAFREALAGEDAAELLAILQAGKTNRDAVAS